MKVFRFLGVLISVMMAVSVMAQDMIVTIGQVDIRVPSPYTITSQTPDALTIQLADEPSTLTVTASPTDNPYPNTIAEIMNASRAEPIEYSKVSLSGIPALVGDTRDTETDDANSFAQMLVVWQGLLYEFTLSPITVSNPFIEETGSAWDAVIADILFFPPDDAPVFIVFETDIDVLQDVPGEVGVTWELINRPDNSNLEFVQILSDGEVVNVELPRTEPFIAASGEGTVAISTIEEGAEFIDLQVRLKDLSDNSILAVSQIILPADVEVVPVPTPVTPTTNVSATTPATSTTTESSIITQFTSEVDLEAQTTTVTWNIDADAVDEVRYQAIGAGGQAVIELLPTQISGTYTFTGNFQEADDSNVAVYGIGTLSAFISGTRSVESTQISFVGENTRPQITVFSTTETGAQVNSLPAQASVTWEVINRPPETNLEFVQVLPGDVFINAELPRPDPFIASTGSGMVNLVAADTFDLTQRVELTVRVRLVDAEGNILTSRDVIIPYIPN